MSVAEAKPVVAVVGCPRIGARVRFVLGELCEVVKGPSEEGDGPAEIRCVVVCRPPMGWEQMFEGERLPPVVMVRKAGEGDGVGGEARRLRVVDAVEAKDLDGELLRVVLGAVVEEVFEALRLTVLRTRPPERLMRALLRMFELPVVDTVKRLAIDVGCGPRTLRAEWKVFRADGSEVGFRDVLSRVLFMRALEKRLGGSGHRTRWTPWETVAYEVSLTPPRLRRLIRVFGGCRPSELTVGDIVRLVLEAARQLETIIEGRGEESEGGISGDVL